MATVNPSRPAALGLLALVPVAVYAAGGRPVVALSAACVLLIVGSLYTMFGAVEPQDVPA